jgi:putative transcriptional regulator
VTPKFEDLHSGNDTADASAVSTLRNQFLIAMPGMSDPQFAGSVIYLADHSEQGALGLVINRAMDLDTRTLFERIELPLPDDEIFQDFGARPVLDGGPVSGNRGFVLHDDVANIGRWSQSLKCSEDIVLTSSKDVLEAVAAGTGPKRMLLSLGYAGWSAGQLEQELLANAWLTAPVSPHILFEVEPQHRLDSVMKHLGIDRAFLSSQAGHA